MNCDLFFSFVTDSNINDGFGFAFSELGMLARSLESGV